MPLYDDAQSDPGKVATKSTCLELSAVAGLLARWCPHTPHVVLVDSGEPEAAIWTDKTPEVAHGQ